jgi:hypothetical protein
MKILDKPHQNLKGTKRKNHEKGERNQILTDQVGLVWWSGAMRVAMEEKDGGQGGAYCHRLGPPAYPSRVHLPAAHVPRRAGPSKYLYMKTILT